MTDINKPVNLNEMIKSIIMRIKLIRCIELKAIVTLSLVLINSGNLLIGSNLFIRDNNDLSADTILRYNHYPTGKLYVYYSKDQVLRLLFSFLVEVGIPVLLNNLNHKPVI